MGSRGYRLDRVARSGPRTRHHAVRWCALAGAIVVTLGACGANAPAPDPAVACAQFDLAAVRASVRALPGWTAATRAALDRGGQPVMTQAIVVHFVAPDQMMVETGSNDVLERREWYLGDRAWLPPEVGQPAQNGVPYPRGDQVRAAAMPLAELDFPGSFTVAEPNSPGPCVLATEDDSRAVFATLDGVYAGDRRTETFGNQHALITVTFEPAIPTILAPPS